MKDSLINLFGNNQCSFPQALVEFAIIGLGFLLLGTLLRSLFGKNHKKMNKELNRDLASLRLDKRNLEKQAKQLNDKVFFAQKEIRELKKTGNRSNKKV